MVAKRERRVTENGHAKIVELKNVEKYGKKIALGRRKSEKNRKEERALQVHCYVDIGHVFIKILISKKN